MIQKKVKIKNNENKSHQGWTSYSGRETGKDPGQSETPESMGGKGRAGVNGRGTRQWDGSGRSFVLRHDLPV